MMGNGDDYVYLLLQDAISAVNQRVNLFAVVVEYGLPAKSNGPDYFCTLKIMDESYQQFAMPITFFAQEVEKLPCVKSVGDIVRLHRVMMRIHNGVAFPWYHKKISSFVLFEGNCGKDFNPYQASSRFHITDRDKLCIAKLRSWFGSYHFGSGLNVKESKEGLNESSLQLKEVKEGHYFDLICKVLHMCQVSEAEALLFVWDGTDAPPGCFESQQDVESDSLPLQLEQVPLSRDILSTFPCIGTVLRVLAGKPFKDMLIQLKVVGHWVQFCNITCKQKFGLWEGRTVPSSRVFLLSDEDNIAQCCQRNYEERLLNEEEHMSLWSFPAPDPITETQMENVGLSTLMEVLTHLEVTHKYKCIVRVISSYPWLAQDFRCPIKPHVYRIRFTLEDSTARVHAYLYGEDGVVFFEGYPPIDVLTSKMNKLLGINSYINGDSEAPGKRNPPWVQVCIKSYYLEKNDPWESRHFRICNTKLVG